MKKLYSLLIALLCSATMAFAYDAEIDGIYYNLNTYNKTAEVTHYCYNHDGWDHGPNIPYTQSEIIIPEKITHDGIEYIVTSICGGVSSWMENENVPGAFENCKNLISITIPKSVTYIGYKAFEGCENLISVNIFDIVAWCNIRIPYAMHSTTAEGEEIEFYNATGNPLYYAKNLYLNGEKITDLVIPNNVVSIRDYAFYNCASLASITIPGGVISIGNNAFSRCSSLTSITIPNSVTSIGKSTFSGCSSLTSITIPNSVTSIGEEAFYYCSFLTSITIPNSVTSIGSRAFYGCSSLTSVQWNVKKCSDFDFRSPFYGCEQITSFTFGDNVEHIPAYLCYGMSKLISITIPNSVTSIGSRAFSGCSSLTSITIPNSVTEIGFGAFYGTPWLENQSDGCVYINNCLYMYKGEMSVNTHIDVKEGTTRICDYVFSGCSSLTSITIPNSVTSIGYGAFRDCTSLTSITIPNSVTSIGSSAFYGCQSLTLITIPNSVTSIGEYTFSGCSSLTSITIPNTVTLIGKSAFSGCSSLTSITIQAENPFTIGEYTFENVPRSIQIKVPCGSKAKYQTAEYWREFINYEEVPAGTLTVDVNDKTMGFATITKQNNCTDDVAQVQAQALAGYEFVRWSDGATENPHILLVTEDMTITAEFRKIGEEPEDKPGEDEKHNNFIVESADKTQGAVEITITAKAIEGFEFDHWSDGSTENPRIVTLDEDVELYAYFRVAAGTGLENSVILSVNVYGSNGILYVEGVETDYHVLDAAGRLIYSGRDAQLHLPHGVYVIAVGGEVQKVVI